MELAKTYTEKQKVVKEFEKIDQDKTITKNEVERKGGDKVGKL